MYDNNTNAHKLTDVECFGAGVLGDARVQVHTPGGTGCEPRWFYALFWCTRSNCSDHSGGMWFDWQLARPPGWSEERILQPRGSSDLCHQVALLRVRTQMWLKPVLTAFFISSSYRDERSCEPSHPDVPCLLFRYLLRTGEGRPSHLC